ncbi:hypothetical protein BKI52_22830 [marine bacterium AO1-C]|nr:hypothetical protein BKI52_22830 [marine bacterium AO1-C]
MSRLELNFPEANALSDDEFFQFCQENQGLKFEKTNTGKIIVMTPTGGRTGSRNIKIYLQIATWNEQQQYGEMFDSSTGFKLPDGSTLAPDASIVSQARWNDLSDDEQEKFPPLCPEFVVELMSKSDQLGTLQAKMQNWLANGAQLAWLIDPQDEKVYIYRPQQELEVINGFDNSLSGEDVLKGLIFNLKVLR